MATVDDTRDFTIELDEQEHEPENTTNWLWLGAILIGLYLMLK